MLTNERRKDGGEKGGREGGVGGGRGWNEPVCLANTSSIVDTLLRLLSNCLQLGSSTS